VQRGRRSLVLQVKLHHSGQATSQSKPARVRDPKQLSINQICDILLLDRLFAATESYTQLPEDHTGCAHHVSFHSTADSTAAVHCKCAIIVMCVDPDVLVAVSRHRKKAKMWPLAGPYSLLAVLRSTQDRTEAVKLHPILPVARCFVACKC
jgi:hypothetical protein